MLYKTILWDKVRKTIGEEALEEWYQASSRQLISNAAWSLFDNHWTKELNDDLAEHNAYLTSHGLSDSGATYQFKANAAPLCLPEGPENMHYALHAPGWATSGGTVGRPNQ